MHHCCLIRAALLALLVAAASAGDTLFMDKASSSTVFQPRVVENSQLEDAHPQIPDVQGPGLQARKLLQKAEEANITIVNTPQEYRLAVGPSSAWSGSHIEIRSHLDLNVIASWSENVRAPQSTQIIRGNCTEKPSAQDLGLSETLPSLDEWKPGQCVLLIDDRLVSPWQALWMHNIYIRHTSVYLSTVAFSVQGDRSVWMTNVTIQGNGGNDGNDTRNGGLDLYGSQFYGKDLTIIDFASQFSALTISNGATVTIEGCTLTRNSISGPFLDSGLITVSGVQSGSLSSQQQDTILRMQNCKLAGNTANHTVLVAAGIEPFLMFDVGVYSDVERKVYYWKPISSSGTSLPLDAAPTSRPGIGDSSPWFINAQEAVGLLDPPEVPGPAPAATSPPTPPPSLPDDPVSPLSNTGNSSESSASAGSFEPISSESSSSESTRESADITGVDRDPVCCDGRPTKDDGSRTARIVVVTVTVVIGGMAVLCIFFIVMRSRQRRTAAKEKNDTNEHTAATRSDDSIPATMLTTSVPVEVPASVPQEKGKSKENAEMQQDSLELFSLAVPERATQVKQEPITGHSGGSEQPQVANLSMISMSQGYSSSVTARSTTTGAHELDDRGQVATVSQRNDSMSDTFVPEDSAAPLPQATGDTMQQQRLVKDTFDMTQTVGNMLPPPGPNASSEDRMDFIQQQLDGFGVETPMFDDLLPLGCGDSERRQGGQAVVQMAIKKGTRIEYAIKFFLSSTAFHEERGLYRQGSGLEGGDLAQFLPQVLNVYPNQDGKIKDLQGHPLPPCIVMERGESLDLWAARRHPDRSQAFSMMHQLATRVKELHELGYVHRDLKPGNVMWLPRENRWTVIDFGCVARTGTAARLGFSLAYAAPEVVAAYRRGDQTMITKESVDVWSLGVMAFELLTGKPALSMVGGKDQVMDRIEGVNGRQLPWEGTLPPAVRRQLGIFRSSVLQLLARDPAQRPSMEEFCVSCDRVLSGSTSVQV